MLNIISHLLGATDEEVKDEASQVKFVNKVKNEISLRKAESLAGLPFGSLAKQAQDNINEVKVKPKEEKPKQKPDLIQQYFKEEYTEPALDKAKEGIGNIVSGIGEVSSKVQGKISKKIGSRLKL